MKLYIALMLIFCVSVYSADSKNLRSIEEYAYEHAFSVLFMPDKRYPYFQSMPYGYQPTKALNSPLWHAELALLLYNEKEFIFETLKALQVDVTYYDAPRTDTQAILVQSLNNCHAIFRGTEPFNLKDALTDSLFLKENWQGRGKVHKGFHRAIDDLFQTTSIIADLRKCQNLTVAGHSLGAALGTLASDLLPEVKKMYSFGAPRIGDDKFVKHHKVPTLRYVHANDIVNLVPFRSLGYKHSIAAKVLPSQHKYPPGVSWNYVKKTLLLPIMDHAMVFYCLALLREPVINNNS